MCFRRLSLGRHFRGNRESITLRHSDSDPRIKSEDDAFGGKVSSPRMRRIW